MTANELADVLENDDRLWFVNENLMVKICAMLRQQQEKLTKYELRHVAQRDRIAILEMQHKQQQAEIEALKKEAALQRLSDFTQEADNEPVAWMLLGLEDRKPKLINLQVIGHLEGTWIPLYTYEQITPSGFLNASKPIYPAKTLTDEEIIEIWSGMETDTGEQNIDFARAILKKAQNK